MSESLVRKVVLAALKGDVGDGGWLKIDAPKATEKEISLAIMEAEERGLVKACEVGHMQSRFPEWRLTGPTGASAKFIRESKLSKKIWATVGVIVVSVLGFLKWLVPMVVSLVKK